MERQYISGNSPWEPVLGFSRAVRVGDRVVVSGTTATDDDGKLVGIGDPYAQTIQALSNIERALARAGATRQHIVRTRLYLADIGQWEQVGRAHGEFFPENRPACTMVGAGKLIDPQMLVEIEAEAIIG